MKNIFKYIQIFSFVLFGALVVLPGCSEDEKDWDVQLFEKGIVDATASSLAINYGESVTFTDNSTKVYTREWSFEGADISSSTESTVTVTYPMGGSFTATLSVTHVDNTVQTKEFTVEVEGPAISQWPFGDAPIAIPGILEFENYDKGGEGKAYHDTEEENKAETAGSATYRDDDGIDVQVSSDGTLINVGYSAAEEWMEYTVNVAEAATYKFDFSLASGSDNGGSSVKIQLVDEYDNITDLGETGDFANTGGWGTYTSLVVKDIELNAGEQVLRFYYTGGGVNLDKVEVTLQSMIEKYGIYTEAETSLGNVGELIINENQAVAITEVTEAFEGSKALEFAYAWTDGAWGYMAEILPANSPADLSAFANGYYNISIKTTSPGRLKLRLQSDGVQGYVWLDDAVKTYGLERDGQWHSLKIPMTDFRVDAAVDGANPDFSKITNLMVLRSEGGVAETDDWTWYIDNIYLTNE